MVPDFGGLACRAVSDTGEADPRLAAALAAHTAGPTAGTRAEVLAAVAGARVFAPVLATSTAEHRDPGTGLRAESTAEMALLTLVGSAGGRAVPLFLDVAGVVAFRPGARPVPLRGGEACAAAREDGAVGVLVDPPGAALAITGGELAELAGGRVPVAGAPLSAAVTTGLRTPEHVDDALVTAVAAALRGQQVRAARLLTGPDGPVLGVVPDRPLDAAGLTALAARVLPETGRPDLSLAVVAPDGPGLPVRLQRARRWRLRRDR
jgi:hypothetical protein